MTSDDASLAALGAPTVVKAAALLHGASGIYVALSAIQLLISVTFVGPLTAMQWLNWALVLVGVLHVGLAGRLYRMRRPWGTVGLFGSLFSCGLVTGWVVANVSFAIFSCMQLGALALAWANLAAAPFALGPIRRAEAARAKLAEGGVDLGI
jgi:hypothetical protein